MKRLILSVIGACVALVVIAVPLSSQQAPAGWPPGMPAFTIPTSAVDGGGTVIQTLKFSPTNTIDLGTTSLLPRSIYWGTQALAPDGTAAAPSYGFASEPTTGLFRVGLQRIGVTWNSATGVEFNNQGTYGGIDLGQLRSVAWGTAYNNKDTYLMRDAANTVAMKNGTNLQTFRVYNASGAAYGLIAGNGFVAPALSIGEGTGTLMVSSQAPTVVAGTGAAIPNANGTAAFTLFTGTTAVSTATISFPVNNTNGWRITCSDTKTKNIFTQQVTTAVGSATIGNFSNVSVSSNWPANTYLACNAVGM